MYTVVIAERIARRVSAAVRAWGDSTDKAFHEMLALEMGRELTPDEQQWADVSFLVGTILVTEGTLAIIQKESRRARQSIQNMAGEGQRSVQPGLDMAAEPGPDGSPDPARALPTGLPDVVRDAVPGEEKA